MMVDLSFDYQTREESIVTGDKNGIHIMQIREETMENFEQTTG